MTLGLSSSKNSITIPKNTQAVRCKTINIIKHTRIRRNDGWKNYFRDIWNMMKNDTMIRFPSAFLTEIGILRYEIDMEAILNRKRYSEILDS